VSGSLRARAATAALGLPLVAAAWWTGGGVWAAFVGLVSFLGGLELRRLLAASPHAPAPEVVVLGGLAFVGAAYIATRAGASGPAALGSVTVAVAVYSLVRETLRPTLAAFPRAAAATTGALYVGGFPAHLVLLREAEAGRALVALALGGAWAHDLLAFAFGRLLGGRRLVPHLSPNKTISGAVAGWLGGMVAVILVGVLGVGFSVNRATALGAAVALAALLGDLVESALKRGAGAKDAGTLLPGHGGVLDRFDSLLLAAPVVYYLLLAWGEPALP